MRWLLAALVIVFAATSGWLWHQLEQERVHASRSQSPVARVQPASIGVIAPVRPETLPIEAGADENHLELQEQERQLNRAILAGTDARLVKNPEYMEARRRYHKEAFGQRYPDLTRVLNVSEETALQIVELSHEEQLRDSGVAINLNDPDSLLKLEQKGYESDAAIAALVGQATLQQWKEYEATIGERYDVKELRTKLMDTREPLSFDEGQSLIRALYEERKRIEAEWQAAGETTGDFRTPITFLTAENEEVEAMNERRMLKVAKAELSSFQFEVYREMRERQRKTQNALDDMFRIGRESLK